jgi:hypothetical protein
MSASPDDLGELNGSVPHFTILCAKSDLAFEPTLSDAGAA